MEILANTKIDFMKYRKVLVTASLALLALSVFTVFFSGRLNLGIDFAGGTQLTLEFRERPRIDELRSLFLAAGVADAQIQGFGAEEDNEVLIKTSLVAESEEGRREQLVAVLDAAFNGDAAGRFDLNQRGTDAVVGLLASLDPDGLGEDAAAKQEHYLEAARVIAEVRRQEGLVSGWEELASKEGLSAATLTALEQNATLGQFAVLGAENVGPQIGSELRRKGVLAVALSLMGMLAYIWIRFELRFGIGAVVASIHDVLITLGLFVLAGFEFNLTTIAAFLTLVGYSVNDTVVVFDRVRENLRRRRTEPLVEVMNESLNQTLSRTVLTSGTTLLAVGCLLVLGGDVLRGFAFIMTVGVLVGTYSSVYIACPFTLLWEARFGREARARRAAGSAGTAAKAT